MTTSLISLDGGTTRPSVPDVCSCCRVEFCPPVRKALTGGWERRRKACQEEESSLICAQKCRKLFKLSHSECISELLSPSLVFPESSDRPWTLYHTTSGWQDPTNILRWAPPIQSFCHCDVPDLLERLKCPSQFFLFLF